MNQKQIHAANNAVIAAARQAAFEQGVSFVIAVGALTDGETPTIVCGVDSNSTQLELHLAAVAHGACAEREEERRAKRSEAAMALGMQLQRDLFDRGDVHDHTDKKVEIPAKEGA